MKWIIFFLIPVLGYSQVKSFDDIRNINSLDSFKRVMIENSYEGGISGDDDYNEYFSYGVREGEKDGDMTAYIWASYYHMWFYTERPGGWQFRFSNINWFRKNRISYYDLIYDDVKKECTFFKILDNYNGDYALYTCPNSKYKGKIGFAIIDDTGRIKHFLDY